MNRAAKDIRTESPSEPKGAESCSATPAAVTPELPQSLAESPPGQFLRQLLEGVSSLVPLRDGAGGAQVCPKALSAVDRISPQADAWQVHRSQQGSRCECTVLVAPENTTLTRWEHGQTRVLERIALGVPLSEVLSVLVEEVERLIPHSHAAVLLLDETGKRFRRGAAPSLPDPLGKLFDGLKVAPGNGCCAAAATSGERVVVPELDSHSCWTQLRPLAQQFGFCASWSEPVYSSTGKFLGTLTVLLRQSGIVEQLNRHWLATAAHLAGIAIERDRSAKELIRAKEEAEASSRAKAQFLANMSHEIRTPMTAILGFADLLREQAAGTAQAELADTIYRNASYLLKIINDILDLSKIEAGKMQLDVQQVCPFQLLEDVKEMMAASAREKGLELKLQFHTPLPPAIHTDPYRLRQILINLVGNAVKFTTRGSVQMVVQLLKTPSRPMLAVDVIDTGVGIPADKLQAIFQPFVQADSSTTRRFGGTGLGLSISLHLAHLLGGTITVESTPGQGSRFRLEVPVGPVDLDRLVSSPQRRSAERGDLTRSDAGDSGQSPRLQGHVLLVEDGPDNRRLVAHILTRYGMQVTTATHGQEALELFDRYWQRDQTPPFDLVLLDMQMPVMDGYTTAAELRRRGWDGPVVALTAFAMAQDRQKCLQAGCDEYLTKPIDKKKLLATLARFLQPAASPS